MIKFCALVFAVAASIHCYSQTNNSTDKESLIITITPNVGFNIGGDYSHVKNYYPVNYFAPNPTLINNAPGFRLGVFGDIKIQEQFTLIPRTELSFNQTTIIQNGEPSKLDPINLDFMLHSKWNFKKRDSKINPYCYLGPGLRVPLNNNSEGNLDTKNSLTGDVSFGLDIEFKGFYLSPEIRYSHGLQNINKRSSFEKLRASYAALVINFTSK